MLNGVANRHTEAEHQNLCDDEERGTKDDIADGPAIFKSAEHEDELRNDVDDSANERPDDIDDPEADWFRVLEASELLECRDGDEE